MTHLELGALSWGKATIESNVGLRGLNRPGRKKWRQTVATVIERVPSAPLLDDVVIGGGDAKELKELPPGCRSGDNACAFGGGFRLWEPVADYPANAREPPAGGKAKKTKKA